jgi:hypothetical protein
MATAKTVTELIAEIQRLFPDPNTLVYLPSGIVSKEPFQETAINSFDELPEDWVMPDSVFEEICRQTDGYDSLHERVWEMISEIESDVMNDYMKETADEQELWEA